MTFGPTHILNNEESNNHMKAMIKVNIGKHKRIQELSMKLSKLSPLSFQMFPN